MNRRKALKTTAMLLGGVYLTSNGVLSACASPPQKSAAALDAGDQALIEEIADTLLPTTAASPGAKAAGVGPAINLILTDCYDAKAQQRVVQGLKDFRATCRERKNADFTSLSRADREQLLRGVDADAKKAGNTHYFGFVRELATGAYFSSQVGTTQALRWIAVPGRFDGCVPLKPGQPAWA